MKINAGNLKKGDFVYYQDQIWQVQKAEFYSPGKGAALMKTRIKNLVSGKNIEYTYKSNEEVESVEVESRPMQYLYKNKENLYFMDERTFDQFHISIKIVGKLADFLKEGEKYYVYFYNERPVNVRPPMTIKL